MYSILTNNPINKARPESNSREQYTSWNQRTGIDLRSRGNCSIYKILIYSYHIAFHLCWRSPWCLQFPNLPRQFWQARSTRRDQQLHIASPNKLWPNKSPPASVPLLVLKPSDPVKYNQLATLQWCLKSGNHQWDVQHLSRLIWMVCCENINDRSWFVA